MLGLRRRHDKANEAGTGAERGPTVRTLARLFREHPAWIEAARHLARPAESAVFFSHLPGRAWHLVRRGGETVLLRGRARDPDFVFCFTPAAIARLAAVKGDIGDFAVELFSRIVEPRAGRGIGFRIVAPFARLARRGYVRLLLAAGPKPLMFGAARGVRTIADVRRLVDSMH